MIEDVGPPDQIVDNPCYQNGPVASLYSVERVEEWIARNEQRVENARSSRARRELRATQKQQAAELAMREAAQAWLDSAWIVVQHPLPPTLVRDARRYYQFSSKRSLLLQRGLRAYVRHHLSNYDELLHELKSAGYPILFSQELRKRANDSVLAALLEWFNGR